MLQSGMLRVILGLAGVLGAKSFLLVTHGQASSVVTLRVSTTEADAAQENLSRTQTSSIPWPLDTEKYGEFNQDRDWGFAYSSAPPEASSSYVIEDIEGQVPSDIQGTYYKVGPGNFEREGRRYNHVLDGDGFVAAFRFENGQVRYTGRFVETEYFLEETQEDKIKYRNVFGTQRKGGALANAFDLTLKNVANTNVLWWCGRLFALWEAGRPYELDPVTLETLDQAEDGPFEALGAADCNIRGITVDKGGPVDKTIRAGRSFTAHPHILDDDTLVAFTTAVNVQNNDAELQFIEYNKDWKKKSVVHYSFPKGPAPHDFSVSDNYYCFFQNPFGDMENIPYILGMKAPTQIMQLILRQPTVLSIVPRGSSQSKEAFTVEVPSYFNIHHVEKAEEKDGRLYLYSNGWDLYDERFFPGTEESVPFLGSWGGAYPDFVGGIVPPALLFRTVVDLKSQQVISHEEVVPGTVLEFPTQDEVNPNHVYFSTAATDYTSMPGTGLCKVDTETSNVQYWWAENRKFTTEMSVVTKRNGEPGSWLLTNLYDAERKRNTLLILDSENFEAGPVCRLHLKHHITYGLHSTFAPANGSV